MNTHVGELSGYLVRSHVYKRAIKRKTNIEHSSKAVELDSSLYLNHMSYRERLERGEKRVES